jgi:hypothetical protein
MNTLARFLAWTLWFCTTTLACIYCALVCTFVSLNFHCYRSSAFCKDHVKSFNNGLNAGSILTMILVCLYIVVSGAFMLSKRRYVEALSVGSSYNLAVCMLLYSIFLHTADPTVISWTSKKKELSFKATYIIGYVLSGVYSLWFFVILLARKKARTSYNDLIPQ